jgi:hypothetical protein
MENEDVLRIKSAMVIFSLEKELGELVKRHANSASNLKESGPAQKILKRESERGALLDSAPVASLVAASFLEEVIGLATAVLADDSRGADMRKLQQLASSFDVYTIRNAVSHPNRTFPECYWYRAAAICSDPVIDRLDLANVRMTLQKAEQGSLQSPPDEWMEAQISFVTNNLPSEIEHEMTGLLGRRDDSKKLQELLEKGRHSLVAVVAPGGTGKTALALDVLKHVSAEPASQKWTDAIVFCSLKQEALTRDGVIGLEAAKTISELKEELTRELSEVFPFVRAETFHELCQELAASRLLLCIDNLETLLRDDPEAFAGFFESLPECWRVLVTSRVTVDGAKTLSLKSLNTDGARSLAVKYLEARGQTVSDSSVVEQIVSTSKNNPLAIRLTIDRYAKGFPLIEAQTSVSVDVVAFSYKNLIDTLSLEAKTILECLFVAGSIQRGDLVAYLGVSHDDIAQAIADLVATSLVSRTEEDDGGETLCISPSVRDLLLENPLDPEARRRISVALRDRKASVHKHYTIQKSQNISPYSEDYVDAALPNALANAIIRCIRLVRNRRPASHRQSADMLREMRKHYSVYGKFPNYRVWLSRLYQKCGDESSAEQELRQAASMDTNVSYPGICYGEFLLRHHRYHEAKDVFVGLRQQGWHLPEKTDTFMSLRVLRGLLKSLAELKDLSGLREVSNELIDDLDSKHLQHVYSAASLIMEAAPMHTSDPLKSSQLLREASLQLKERPNSRRFDVKKDYEWAVRFFFLESRHVLFTCSDPSIVADDIVKGWRALELQFKDSFDQTRDRKLNPAQLVRDFRTLEHSKNPFNAPKWDSSLGAVDAVAEAAREVVARGYKLATIRRVPETNDHEVVQFVIAEREDGEPLFVHRGACQNFDWLAWSKLTRGDVIAYESERDAHRPGQYPVAQHVLLLDN